MTDILFDTHQKKKLGIYYTDQLVADFLVSWAIDDKENRILDPSYGDGVFIVSAFNKIKSLGGGKPQVFGVDINPGEGNAGSADLPFENLVHSDFFQVEPSNLGKMDAVVGNPPFIRYQRFNGETRKNALKICQGIGLDLPELTSSWAPFLGHATRFIKPGGRLAMVVPSEINHASYAQPLLKFLLKVFGQIKIIAFRQHIFPELSQDTFLLLASDYGQECKDMSLHITENAVSLNGVDLNNGIPVDTHALRDGKQRLLLYLLPRKARDLYSQLTGEKSISKMGVVANIGIGYVSGANEFFHLSASEVEQYRIPGVFLKKAVRSGRQLKGVRYTEADWRLSEQADEKIWLLSIPSNLAVLPAEIEIYLKKGIEGGVSKTYKCQARHPWYTVPNVYVGDLFLTYMCGDFPKLVSNEANATTSNTLHVLKLTRDLFTYTKSISPETIAALWHTSLTLLSAEIEGHALGGGMLKIEPSEAEKILVSLPDQFPDQADIENLDNLLRNGEIEDALEYSDKKFLTSVGLTKNDLIELREGRNALKEWRMR